MLFPDAAMLAIFAAACLALYGAPGPDMIYIASRSLGQGRRAGALSALGTCTGLLCHPTAASLGLGALLAWSPLVFLLVR